MLWRSSWKGASLKLVHWQKIKETWGGFGSVSKSCICDLQERMGKPEGKKAWPATKLARTGERSSHRMRIFLMPYWSTTTEACPFR